MKTVYKYPLEVMGFQEIAMPGGAEILCVQVQRDAPCLWAMVDNEARPEPRSIRVYGTGHYVAVSEDLAYIGTFQLVSGEFIGHVFEVK